MKNLFSTQIILKLLHLKDIIFFNSKSIIIKNYLNIEIFW